MDPSLGDLFEQVRKRGGYDHLVFGGEEGKEIKISIVASLGLDEFNYEISFEKREIIEERLTLKEREEKRVLYEGKDGRGQYFDELKRSEEKYSFGTSTPTICYLKDLKRTSTVIKFYEYLKNWRYYSFVPSMMRLALPVERKIEVEKRGEHLAQVLHTILSDRSPSYDEIEDVLTNTIKETERLLSPLEANMTTYVAVKEKFFKTSFDYYQLSDGTLRFLAHLAVLFNPHLPTLVCFEEPENHIHPSLFEFLVNICKRAKTQIIITTHAPYLVDWVEPEYVRVIEKEEGRTMLAELDKKELKKALEEKIPLGELLFE